MVIEKTEQVFDSLKKFRDFGSLPGKDIGFAAFDDIYTFKLGTCTDISGYPYMGKSLLVKEIALNITKQYGYKGFLYMPDDGNPVEVIAHFVQKLSGKPFNKLFGTPITDSEISRELEWLLHHFKFYQRGYKEKRITPKQFYQMTIDEGCNYGVLDSWNYLDHGGKITTEYLADVLSMRNEMAEQSNVHYFQIIHPRNPSQGDYDKEGKLKRPGVYNMMGGSEWNNNGKNLIFVHKDSKDSKYYDIYVDKTKPRSVGSIGHIQLAFDMHSQNFYTEFIDQVYGGEKRSFAFKNIKDSPEEQWASNKTLTEQRKEDDYPF